MLVTGTDRRSLRRIRRSVSELDQESRLRLRQLLDGSRFVVLPTSEAIPLIEARLVPGTIPISVSHAAELGVDQTIAVAEVLATRGHDVTVHLAALHIRSSRHLDEILLRMARRSISRALVVRGSGDRSGPFESAGSLLRALSQHQDAPADIGTAAEVDTARDRDVEAGRLLERATSATYVSVGPIPDVGRLLGWVAEMRIRGLLPPIEIGVPGVVGIDELVRENPGFAGGRRRSEWYDPTGLVTELARDRALEQLDVSGLRIETLNRLDATAAWRQRIYDLAAAPKEVRS